VAIWSGADEIYEEGSRNAVWDHKEGFSVKRLKFSPAAFFGRECFGEVYSAEQVYLGR